MRVREGAEGKSRRGGGERLGGVSRNSYILSPRRVAIVTMALPSRSLKLAMDFLALVMIGFWPVICESSSTAVSRILAFEMASPMPMFRTTFSILGTAIGFLI